jgi:uncharacterized membrane-anchored protein
MSREHLSNRTPLYRRIVTTGLLLSVLFQLTVLGVEYLGSVWPLWFGERVALETVPVDPRSLFRGDYIRLNYAISTIDSDLARTALRRGEVAYVTLAPRGETYAAVEISRVVPSGKPFIRGRVVSAGGNGAPYRMRYGIEAYFLPRAEAETIERTRRGRGRATVYLLDSGRAAVASFN